MGVYLVIKNNFKRAFQHKVLFGITLLLPVLICLIAGIIKIGEPSVRVGILVEDINLLKSESNQELFDILDRSKGIKYAIAEEESFHTDLISGKFQVVLDYRDSDAISDFQLISYQNEGKREAIKAVFTEAFMKQAGIDLSGLKIQALTTTERSFALILTLFMIFSTIYASVFILDKQNGTYSRYRFAQKNKNGYVFGYILYNFIITFVSLLLCISVLMTVQKGFHISLAKGLIMSIIIAVIATTFSTSICFISKSEMQANITSSSLTALMSLLGGTFIAVESMPRLLQLISYASPIRWVVELLRHI